MTGVQRPRAAARFALSCVVAVGAVLALVTAAQLAAVAGTVAVMPGAATVGAAPFAAGPAVSALGLALQWDPRRSLAVGAAVGVAVAMALSA